jgi:hypothetical protein
MDKLNLKIELNVFKNRFNYKVIDFKYGKEIKEITSFLDNKIEENKLTLKLRVYCIVNDILTIDDFPKCVICGKLCKFDENKNIFKSSCYDKKCCYSARDIKVTKEMYEMRNKNRENTVISKYNCKNISNLDEVKIKKVETTNKNYNCDNPFQSDEIKNRIKITNLNTYGCENPSGNLNVKLKKIKTCLEKRGVIHHMKVKSISDDVTTKMKKTLSENDDIKHAKDGIIYSKIACDIIDEYGKNNGFSFSHAENGGEFKVRNGKIIYSLDGYDKFKNVAVEVDGQDHFHSDKLRKKDIERENIIKEILGCKFIRIRLKGNKYNVYQE